ncbi:Nitroreductase [Colwellia chukchiensis]|uniref:Nitroreductase n=1 Tax=Colwellia chukchiensis TaxID=641665 RepID=A0A1H7HBM4_9GAMM|nr:nitroreductase family protein [Colwellia chukchiensis]SEK46732.1 Nitroreductase [Colwellia chukchiensis]
MRALLKRIITKEQVEQLRMRLEQFDRFILPFFVKSRFLSSFYYCFFSRRFAREHQSVLKGRIQYYANSDAPENSSVLLRRNIHRLEKGIIMRPQRATFAEGYIGETVAQFNKCFRAKRLNGEEEKWAKEVLLRYFALVGESDIINAARREFFDAMADQQNCDKNLASVPYAHKDIVRADISFEQFKQLCVQRRSVRWFQDKPVPRELIDNALNAATLAPSACNRQPFEFYLFNEPEQAQKVGAIPMGTAGFSHNFQSVVVVVGDLAAYPYERDRHVIYIDGSLAAMQFMLALETQGLGSCVINWPDVEQLEKKMSKLLKLSHNQRPLMVISLGYADPEGKIPFSQKKSAKELIKEVSL